MTQKTVNLIVDAVAFLDLILLTATGAILKGEQEGYFNSTDQ